MAPNPVRIRAADKKVERRLNEELYRVGFVTLTTTDNGGRPFQVTVCENADDGIDVVVLCKDAYAHQKFGKTLTLRGVDRVWVGCGEYGKPGDSFVGNTVLLTQGNKCTSVASAVLTFSIGKTDNIVRYVSTMGNSAVPYGWIETSKGLFATSSFNCVQEKKKSNGKWQHRVVFFAWDQVPRDADAGCLTLDGKEIRSHLRMSDH